MNRFVALFLICGVSVFSGCRPYNEPKYEPVESYETAFVVPLEGDVETQVKFDSAAQMERYKVAAKRIQIPRRWHKSGYLWLDGYYMDMIRVIKVDRSPVTVTWSKASDNAIWLESNDSVGFSTGFSVTAMVEEKDASTYLYRYRGAALTDVLNNEGRARFQSIASSIAGSMKMDLLRKEKDQIIAAIVEDVIPFFAERGITITTIGQFGGFEYENAKITEAVDNVFVAQQEKEVAAAQLAAQHDINARLKSEGTGIAEKLREEAKGRADAAVTAAEGEAKAIALVADAAAEAASNPTFIELKKIEVQQKQIDQWDGRLPVYSFGDNGANLMLNLPNSK